MHVDGRAEGPLEALAGRLRRLENVAQAEELMDAEAVDLRLDIDVGRVHGPPQRRDLLLLDLQRAGQQLEAGRPARPRHRAADDIDADDDVHALARPIEGNRVDAAAIDQWPAMNMRAGNDPRYGDRSGDGVFHDAAR